MIPNIFGQSADAQAIRQHPSLAHGFEIRPF